MTSIADSNAAPRRIIIIANGRSGAASGNQAAAAVCEALQALGCVAEVWTAAKPAELPGLLLRAREAAPDVVAICGGDGSVNAAANALAGSGIAFGIVPQGTFNLVARRYLLPEEPGAIAELFANGAAQTIGAGRVGTRLFLNNCSFGLYTDVIDARERHTARWGRMRIVAVFSALSAALKPSARLSLRVFDAQKRSLFAGRASLVMVGVNPLQFESAGLPEIGQRVAAGALGAVLVRSVSALRLLPLLFGAAADQLAKLDEVEPTSGAAFEVELVRKQLRVVLDGEVQRLASPLRFDYVKDALRLMMPKQ